MSNTNQQDVTDLPSPSVAYHQAFESPVYRLSELMFGSLLAAYVLGFIGFAAVYSTPSSEPITDILQLIVNRAPFFFISITFAYVTAGFYVTYHAGILTMHHMPLENLSYDFALALSQALLFGISMLHPLGFPVLLAVALTLAVLRQWQEHRALAESFDVFLHPRPAGDPRSRRKNARASIRETRRKLRQLLKGKDPELPLLKVWLLPRTLLLYSALLVAVGVGSTVFVKLGFYDKTKVLFIVSFVTCGSVVGAVHFTLSKRASLLYNKMADMDKQFSELVKAL